MSLDAVGWKMKADSEGAGLTRLTDIVFEGHATGAGGCAACDGGSKACDKVVADAHFDSDGGDCNENADGLTLGVDTLSVGGLIEDAEEDTDQKTYQDEAGVWLWRHR
jgi:hypothetical protein